MHRIGSGPVRKLLAERASSVAPQERKQYKAASQDDYKAANHDTVFTISKMAAHTEDRTWMWHPEFSEDDKNTAGLFVHFRKFLDVNQKPPHQLNIQITADTRYKLYINHQLAAFGPVKGDENLWFYDEVDIGPYIKPGRNVLTIVVLRFFYASNYAPSFPRLPVGGLRIVCPGLHDTYRLQLESSPTWETTIDASTSLRVDEPEDDFLHVYERVQRLPEQASAWVPAKLHSFQTSTGHTAPWRLQAQLIPPPRISPTYFSHMHNIRSSIPESKWLAALLPSTYGLGACEGLVLAPRTVHEFNLEVDEHTTAFLYCRFQRPKSAGGRLTLTYSESYEDLPTLIPYLRRKQHRRDTSKLLYGPSDIYTFEGPQDSASGRNTGVLDEVYSPFHWRTFRFVRVQIEVGASPLVLQDFKIEAVNYPLDVKASFDTAQNPDANQIWSTSIRTLRNCMHDCYEDCPFYEQLQYAMDTRSSALFTYYASGDDRLARQAIQQLHASFDASTSLTSSRAPSHHRQTIPHFSLFWICMIKDHLTFFNDLTFAARFTSVIDGVLNYFESHIDPLFGLVASDSAPGMWNFVDWTAQWRPYGIPPAAARTGFSTYTNHLYAYTLRRAAAIMSAAGRRGLADEYMDRAARLVEAIKLHCFSAAEELFTDGLAKLADPALDYSQHNQVWAVLSGVATGVRAQRILRRAVLGASSQSSASTSLTPDAPFFTPTSVSMSFYTMRAVSMVGGGLYEEFYDGFWGPWREQLALGLTTWEEDAVSQRSDCHAWGSVAIYEFMAEAAGIRPATAGWSSVTFQPRLELYGEMKVTVPIPVRGAGVRGVEVGTAHVEWSAASEIETRVTLRLCLPESVVVPVYVKLPGQAVKIRDSSALLTYLVPKGSSHPVAVAEGGDFSKL